MKIWRGFAGGLALLLLASAAFAQSNTVYQAPWGQVGTTVTLSASNSSSRVALTWQAAGTSPAPPSLWVHNSGTVDVYIALGDVTVTATTSGVLVAAGGDVLVALNGQTYLAGITASSTATLSIAAGVGSPLAKGGGGGPGATGMLTSGSNATSAALDNIAGAASNTFTAAQSMPALVVTGTGSTGTIDLTGQTGVPSVTARTRIYAGTTGAAAFGWIDSTGLGVKFNTELVTGTPTIKIPNHDGGTLITDFDTGTVTNTMLAGSITNAKLSNSSITVAGHSISLGGTQAIACADLSNAGTACPANTGTSGHVVPYLDGNNTTSGNNTHSGTETFTGLTGVAKFAAGVIGGGAGCSDLSGSGAGCTADAATTSTAGIVKRYDTPLAIGWIAAVDPNKSVVATLNQASTVTGIVGTVAVAVGSAATVQVNKAPSGTACASGTNLATGTFDANGTALTNQTLTLAGGAADNLAAGDRICLVTTGGADWTGGSGIGGITVFVTPQ